MSLEELSGDDARALAYAAADRGELARTANPYPTGTAEHRRFDQDYATRVRWLDATG